MFSCGVEKKAKKGNSSEFFWNLGLNLTGTLFTLVCFRILLAEDLPGIVSPTGLLEKEHNPITDIPLFSEAEKQKRKKHRNKTKQKRKQNKKGLFSSYTTYLLKESKTVRQIYKS